MFDDPNKIFKIPLKEKDGKRVMQLIQYFSQVSSKGGGKVPLDDILILANWQSKKESIRITKQRGDLILKSRKGQMKGTFLNSGQRLREKVSDASMLSPDIIVEKKIFLNFFGLPQKDRTDRQTTLKFGSHTFTLRYATITIFYTDY